jgi:RNA polymerase sigma-70 factor (ECF subfamily)
MFDSTGGCCPDEIAAKAECLLGHLGVVERVLRCKGFTESAIEHAVTAVYRAAMPYILGIKTCLIDNRRAWVFKVAIRAAKRAAMREVRYTPVEPAILAATLQDAAVDEEEFDIRHVLSQLTEQQSEAVGLCVLDGMSYRDAARSMGISPGTLCRHLQAAKKRLAEILASHVAHNGSDNSEISAGASAS